MYLDSFITSALVILIATSIAIAVFKYLHLGSVLGLLVAGIIVGPYSPGPTVTQHVEDVRNFTELGVVLLLFLIGIEMKPSRLWSMRRDVFGLGSLQIILSGLAIGFYFLAYQPRWSVAFLIGMTFALSSTAFVLQLLQERGEIASKHGTTAFSVLLMQDMAIVPLLAIVPLMSLSAPLSGTGMRWGQVGIILGTIILLSVLGRYIMPAALNLFAKQRNKEGFLLVVFLVVIFAAWAMHLAGASMALGAFIMGVSLSSCRFRHQIQASIEPFKGIFMGLFFVAVGMSIDFRSLANELSLFVQHTVVIIGLKIIVLFILIMVFGYSRKIATRVSLLLAQGGEFGFVLFGSAKALNVIDDATFIFAIGIISVSMLLTPIMMHLANWLTRNMAEEDAGEGYHDSVHNTTSAKVIIGGYGRVGHAVAVLLQSSGVPFIAFDTDPKLVKQGQEDGFPVYYGDVGDIDLLNSAHAEHALMVILTIDHGPTAERAVSHIRNQYPSIPVIARARDLVAVSKLMEAGATHAYPEAVESSLRLGALALEILNIPQDNVDLLMRGVRSDGYKLIEDGHEEGEGHDISSDK
ncbi:MAG: cation:proton antiporter [Gammaproteobacteria bacterium]|nr:cation:proton antiporter [Gammaproteobacteria bacterium]